MAPEPDMTINEISKTTQELAFMSQPNWLEILDTKLDHATVAFYKGQLQKAAPGMGYCIDERPEIESTDVQTRELKPAFVGGAAGWVMMYMLMGKSMEEAVQLTDNLYQKMNWGIMEVHTDNHHHEEGKVGCGFLNVQQKVIATLQALKIPNVSFDVQKISGDLILKALQNLGPEKCKTVILAGDHKQAQAKVVINNDAGQTLDRQALYQENPAFLWDAWATVNENVLQAFNEVGELNLNKDNFFQIQATMHLATGKFLNAVRLEGADKNVVLLK